MDMKASARSKRVQSQKSKQKFNTHKNKHTSSSASQSHQGNKDQVLFRGFEKEKPIQDSSKNEEPSSYNPYYDPLSEEEEEVTGDFNKDGSLRIKSKGADYSYLLKQFQEQSEFERYPSEYDDGISSMLKVRGKTLLSWGEDDNFFVNPDDSAFNFKASFLSMDLHGLASELVKLDLSKRLFIEDDLLPAEKRAQVNDDSNKSSNGAEQHFSSMEASQGMELGPEYKDDVAKLTTCRTNNVDSNISTHLQNMPDHSMLTFKEPPFSEYPVSLEEKGGNAGDSNREYNSNNANVNDYKEKTIKKEHPTTEGELDALLFDRDNSSKMPLLSDIHRQSVNRSSFGSIIINSGSTESFTKDYSKRSPQKIIPEAKGKSTIPTTDYLQKESKNFVVSEALADLDALLDANPEPSEVKQQSLSGHHSMGNLSSQRIEPLQRQTVNPPPVISEMGDINELLASTSNAEYKNDKRPTVVNLGHSNMGSNKSSNVPSVSIDDFDAWLDDI